MMAALRADIEALGAPKVQSGDLYFGNTKVSADAADGVVKRLGGAASIFVKSGDQYVRVATTLKKEDGPVKLATIIRRALAESKTPLEPSPASPTQTSKIDIDTDQLDQIIGAKGKIVGGVYQFSIPRRDAVTENGMPAPAAMGTGTAINFQPTGGGKAAIAGDFVVTADELNPMIKALEQNGIEVVAIHNHMLEEQPRLFFVHFWAHDDAAKLAHGLRSALEKMAVARG
jgi:hypothetical protein